MTRPAIIETLRNLKVGETHTFAQYTRTSQVSTYIARLRPYGYVFKSWVDGEPRVVKVTRLQKDQKDIADLL